MKCLIVEDEELAGTSLKMFCEKIDDLEVVAICENATVAIEYLQVNTIDLLFLDVELPGINGIDLIRELEELPLIIFTTGKKEYAAEAFEFRDLVIDYITKPVTLTRLINAVGKARLALVSDTIQTPQCNYLFIRTEGRLVRIDYSELQYIETVGDYVKFITINKQFIVHSTLKNIASKINHSDIMKVHRSYIINLSKVVDIEDNTILIGKKVIPVSRSHRPLLLKKINPL